MSHDSLPSNSRRTFLRAGLATTVVSAAYPALGAARSEVHGQVLGLPVAPGGGDRGAALVGHGSLPNKAWADGVLAAARPA